MATHHKRQRRKPMSDINVVPYIDVMLVLLIIFMITAPMLTQGVQVDLPQASANPIEPSKDNSEPLLYLWMPLVYIISVSGISKTKLLL